MKSSNDWLHVDATYIQSFSLPVTMHDNLLLTETFSNSFPASFSQQTVFLSFAYLA